MDAQKVDMFLMTNAKYFEGHQVNAVREKLLALDDSRAMMLHTINLKDPTTMLIVSLLAGAFGIDRFMIGDTGLGVGKLLTCGGLGIWSIVDWFLIQGRTKEVNFTKVMSLF
ncbi:MAG: TM2 domain-containing protein [Cyclobacteriaceae bacterium]